MKKSDKYYVYHLVDPVNNLPFYVGKGYGNRIYTHEKESKKGKIPNQNLYLYNSIKKILNENLNIIYKKINENLNENDAFLIESSEIKKWGRKNNNTGILTNMTDGGEGFSGFSKTKETIKKMSDTLKGRPTWASTHKDLMSEMMLGENNPFYGKKHLNETKEKIKNSLKNMYKKFGHPLKGRPKSLSHRKKISEYQKGKKLSEETKKRMSETHRKQYQILDEWKCKILELYNNNFGCKKILKELKKEGFPYSIQIIKRELKDQGFDLSNRNSLPKKVKIIFKLDNSEMIFNSIKEASKYLKCGSSNLSKIINKKIKSNKYDGYFI